MKTLLTVAVIVSSLAVAALASGRPADPGGLRRVQCAPKPWVRTPAPPRRPARHGTVDHDAVSDNRIRPAVSSRAVAGARPAR